MQRHREDGTWQNPIDSVTESATTDMVLLFLRSGHAFVFSRFFLPLIRGKKTTNQYSLSDCPFSFASVGYLSSLCHLFASFSPFFNIFRACRALIQVLSGSSSSHLGRLDILHQITAVNTTDVPARWATNGAARNASGWAEGRRSEVGGVQEDT